MTLDTSAPPYRRRWAALVLLLVAEAMNLLDSTIMTVAAPVIHRGLGGSASDIQWFSAAYTLPFAVFLITGGRLGDIAGRRRIFRIGVAGFVLASLACALAPSTGALIAARAVQGTAAALVIPQTLGMIRAMFDGREMTTALGTIGPVMGLSAVLGPVLGGVLTQADILGSSWRSVFLVNVPLGAGVLFASGLLREDRSERRPRLDLTGTTLAILGTGLVIYPLIQGNTAGWPVWTWVCLVLGVATLVVFGLNQRHRARRGHSVLVEPGLFENRGFSAALASSVLFFAVVTGLMMVIVLQLQLGRHTGVQSAGFTLLPWSGAMAVGSLVAGTRLVPRYGARVMFPGLVALLAGVAAAIAVYATASPAAYPWSLLPALAVCGIGQALFAVPFFTVALHRVRPHETGSAAGLLNGVQQLGGTLGVALLGTVFFHTAGTPEAVLHGTRNAFAVAAVLVVATVVTAVRLATLDGRARGVPPVRDERPSVTSA